MSRCNEAEDYYSTISQKIKSLQNEFGTLKKKKPEYCFTCLSIQNIFFKNAPDDFDESFIETAVVDGRGDGGVDAIFTDPDSDNKDMVLVQTKYYKTISLDEVKDAIHKMIDFANDMENGHYEIANENVRSRYLDVESEKQDSAKTVLVFVTCAPRGKIRNDNCAKALGKDRDKFDLRVYFDKEICDEIREKEERRQSIEYDKIGIDKPGNWLEYDEARIVNVSALSIKTLFSRYKNNLLASNLRYYVKGKIDGDINKTINENQKGFWYRNNGLTIVCEDYEPSGKEIHLRNFSIVNGGQTTKLLSENANVNEKKDFFIPCKIIKAIGETNEKKANFLYEVAKATNSQKPIKPIDLKSNAPEQLSFVRPLRDAGVCYLTKRGEKPSKGFSDPDKHTTLDQVAKLCLAGVFQLPARARNNTAKFFDNEYYDLIFKAKDLNQIAKVVSQLLKISLYFEKRFINKYVASCNDEYGTPEMIPFARNAKTTCIAFASLAARIINGEISPKIRESFAQHSCVDGYENYIRPAVANTKAQYSLFNETLVRDADAFEEILWKLFDAIISQGYQRFELNREKDSSLIATNYLKKDQSYFEILASGPSWKNLIDTINEIRTQLPEKTK